MIVDALGDREERRVAVDDHPSRVDARAPRVGEERLQELGDTPAGRGRVHVDDAPPEQADARPFRRLEELLGALGSEQLREPFERGRVNLDFVAIDAAHVRAAG